MDADLSKKDRKEMDRLLKAHREGSLAREKVLRLFDLRSRDGHSIRPQSPNYGLARRLRALCPKEPTHDR